MTTSPGRSGSAAKATRRLRSSPGSAAPRCRKVPRRCSCSRTASSGPHRRPSPPRRRWAPTAASPGWRRR